MSQRSPLHILKVGGAIVEDEARLGQLLADFAAQPGRKLLVHGGGRRATKVAEALGVESRMVEGRRVTSREMLEVVTMVYGGLVNKNIVARLQALGVNAIGMTGADMNIILSHKRQPVMMTPAGGEPQKVDFGYVGDVDRADGRALHDLIEASGATPVLAPLTHDGHGQLLNTNADTIASATAVALAPFYEVTLQYSFEKAGVLRDPADEASVIGNITPESFVRLKDEGVISGGMLPKVANALRAVAAGVKEVRIANTVITA